MSSFYVNGNIVKCEGSMSLLRYLRDELRLTSVKDGCSEGACGTCTVIIDGRAMKACVQRTDRLGGRHTDGGGGATEATEDGVTVCIRLLCDVGGRAHSPRCVPGRYLGMAIAWVLPCLPMS